MSQNSELSLEALSIGSLPHNNLEKAMELVKENFNIPFWPQLTKISKNEDMIVQFLENMPSFFSDREYLDTDNEQFYEDLEQFFTDYEECMNSDLCHPELVSGSKNEMPEKSETLDKYAIKSSLSFPEFLKIIKETKPKYAKGQIVGPFTLSTTLVDKQGRCAFYDETLREIIVKTLALKALWQINKIKSANPSTTPIIFIDEPSISQLGTSAFLTVSQDEVAEMIKEISDLIKQSGALSAIHCCGKCDWALPVKADVNIINLDAYKYAQNLSLFAKNLKPFLENGGKIAWGVVPTLDTKALESMDLDKAISIFEKAVKYLTKKGIDEKIVIENSLITPSCGAGALSEELARKAMQLTKELSDNRKRYYDI